MRWPPLTSVKYKGRLGTTASTAFKIPKLHGHCDAIEAYVEDFFSAQARDSSTLTLTGEHVLPSWPSFLVGRRY